MNDKVRPNKLWHYFAIAALTATFFAEPRAFVAVTWELFRGAGAVGGALISGGINGDTDVMNLDDDPPFGGFANDDDQPGNEVGPNDGLTGPDQPQAEPTPDAPSEPEGASAPGGCETGSSCVYGVPLPAPADLWREAERLHEMTNGALGCLMTDFDPSELSTGPPCLDQAAGWRAGITANGPRTIGGGTAANGEWIPVLIVEPEV